MNKKLLQDKYPELLNIVEKYADQLSALLGDNFIGLYLQGSLAIGDFDLTSDVDFIVITKKDLDEKEVKVIQDAHLKIYNQDNRWVKRLEYSFFPYDKLTQLSSPAKDGKFTNEDERKLWYFDNGSKSIERSDHCNTIVTRWTLREKGVTIKGPEINNLIPPIPTEELRKEIKNTMITWAEDIKKRPDYLINRFYQSFMVLNYSRMLQDLYEGKVTSKYEGIQWAKYNLDKKWTPLIDFCWEERKDTGISIKQPINQKIFEKALDFVEYATDLAVKYEV